MNKNNWRDNEDGPDCECGWPRVVKRLPDGRFVLMCFGHTGEAGQVWALPPEKPDGWPGNWSS